MKKKKHNVNLTLRFELFGPQKKMHMFKEGLCCIIIWLYDKKKYWFY